MKLIFLATIAISLQGSLYAQNPMYEFGSSLAFGGAQNDEGESITFIGTQDVLVFGQFRGTVNFNPMGTTQNMSALGSPDLFLARYSQESNELIWSLNLGRIGLSNGMNTTAVKTTTDSNILLAGSFSSNVNFNPLGANTTVSAVAGKDAFLAKYNENGTLLWLRTFGTLNFDVATALEADADGNAYFAMSFSGQLDVDPGAATVFVNSNGGEDAVVIKLSEDGEYIWHRLISTSGIDEISTIGTSGNFLAFGGQINGSSGPFPEAELFGSLMNTGGSEIWTIELQNLSAGNRMGQVCVVESVQRVYFGGEIQAATDFDPSGETFTLTPFFKDIFVASYSFSTDVNDMFHLAFSPRSAGINSQLAWLHVNHPFIQIAGSFDVNIDFEQDNPSAVFNSAGAGDIFAAVYQENNNETNYEWASIFGGTHDEFAHSGTGESVSGKLMMTGSFLTSLGIDPNATPVSAIGGRDVFFASFTWPLNLSVSGNAALNDDGFTLFPVPSSDELFFTSTLVLDRSLKIKIFEPSGKLLSEQMQRISPGSTYTVPIKHLTSGLYFVEFSLDDSRVLKRFIKR